MGTLPRCLCLILTLLIAGLRPSAGVRGGSQESDPWWGTKDAIQIRLAFERARNNRDFAALEIEAERAEKLALLRHARLPAVRYLINLGAARLAQFRYRKALDAFLEARRMAGEIGDTPDQAAVEVNLSSLFYEMADLDSARRYAEQAYARSRPLPHPYYAPQLRYQLGKVYSLQRDPRAAEMFRQGIEAAREQGRPADEAQGWDFLGDECSRNGQSADAEHAFTEAFRLRRFFFPAGLPFSYARFGALRLAQGRLPEAERFTNLALAAGSQIGAAFPKFLLIHQRGEIRLARGDTGNALRDFEQAADLASLWRQETLPAISALTATNVDLQKHVFDSLVDTAAHRAVERHDSRLAWKAFQALEDNRAASLREVVALGGRWQLPVQYWDELGQMRAEQARLELSGRVTSPRLESIRTRIAEMEAETGIRTGNKVENFRTRNSLIHLRQVLSNSQLLLSFRLGEQESYVWAITRRTFRLYRLGPADEIRAHIARFRDAVRQGRPEAAELGARLYAQLFGGLDPGESRHPKWVISAEDALLEAPLSAAVPERKGSGLKYLVQRHSLQFVPGAMSLAGGQVKRAGGEWLGVGDPIYNRADPRWHGENSSGEERPAWLATAAVQMNRLVGSGEELRASARSWPGSLALLEGADATREKFEAAIARHPGVIHLATHVIAPVDRAGQALIAFGLNASGTAQFLSTGEIAMLRVPGAVVSMAGCATGAGEIRAGAGLLGLTRAWQMAGASTVIGALWPVPDAQGDLFPSFYRYLREMPAAEAMRRSQIDMIQAGGWRAAPKNWAAYLVTGGVQ